MDNGSRNGSQPVGTGGDVVTGVVERVRAELAARRARGELPRLPDGELGRQFDAVVEAADAGLVEEPPLPIADLARSAELPSWRPAGAGSVVKRLVALALRVPAKFLGAVVRRQVGEFAARTSAAVDELATRQARMAAFLGRAHLDRIRTLEYRVAQLEEEVIRLRSGAELGADTGTDTGTDADATVPG